jgi:hypothetical protein
VTEHGIQYVIYFLDYSGMFTDYPEIAHDIFMFNIDVTAGDPDHSPGDDRIGITILSVFNLFFRKSQNVAVYVCDALDNRHLSRKRKFDIWFWKYNDGSLIKEDDVAIVEGVEIYNSLILHKRNEHLREIILAYKELNERAGTK